MNEPKEYAILPMSDTFTEPDPSTFNNPIAYRVAFILWSNGVLADALRPEEMAYLRAAPREIERWQRFAMDLQRRQAMPPFIVTTE